MNLNHLEYFSAAYETGSISEAAKRVYVSQQSVSAAVAALERELHATLLIRSRSGVTPTHEGHIFYQACSQLFETLESMRADVSRERRNVAGDLAFAYIPEVFLSCGLDFASETLRSFAESWPGINLEAFRGQADFCQNIVKQGDVELALVTAITDTMSFRVIPIWECPVLIYVQKDHELASRAAVSFADLRGRKLLSPPNSGYPLWEIISHCRTYGFTPDIVSADEGRGGQAFFQPKPDEVAFVLGGFTVSHHDDGHAVIPLVEEDRIFIPANIIVKAGHVLSPQAEALVEHIKRCFAAIDAALAERIAT